MEVCFIKGDYRDFLREHSPEIDNEVGPGWFVNSEGVKLGGHKGFPYYTIGQRKGLEIALGKPGLRAENQSAEEYCNVGRCRAAQSGIYACGTG